MSDSDQRSKVTLEDLLRLKRAERPGPEFWANFESELRQKQLTALVQKRRWWHDLPVLFNRRLYLPAGAAAVVAFTLVTVRYASPTQIAQVPNTAQRIAAADPAVEMLAPTEVTELAGAQSPRREETVAQAVEVSPTREVLAAVPAKQSPREVDAPAARSLAASFSRLEEPVSDLIDSQFGGKLSAPPRVQPATVQSEVVAMTPATPAKYQLIARYADRALSPAPSAPAVVRERLARRLGDDIGDGSSRIGVVSSDKQRVPLVSASLRF